MCKKLGGNRTEIAESNWPKVYSVPYDVMLSNKSGRS